MSVSVQAGGLLSFVQMNSGMKSTQEKAQRQQKCASQVDFFEKQKENLKNMECTSLEDIARKLEMFHSYEDQIAEIKKQYNNSQMMHVLDEAEEIGKKIAEEAEKTAPKTEEERKKDKIEEALGTDEESKGMLTEIMDEITEVMEEIEEELEEEIQEELDDSLEEGLDNSLEEGLDNSMKQEADSIRKEGLQEEIDNSLQEELNKNPDSVQISADASKRPQDTLAEAVSERIMQEQMEQRMERKAEEAVRQQQFFDAEDLKNYRHIDYRL